MTVLTPRRRLTVRLFVAGVVAVTCLPVLLPILGLRVGFETWSRQLGWPTARRRGPWVFVWWWYGYHLGLYRLDWRMKRRRDPDYHARIRDWCDLALKRPDPDDWFAEPTAVGGRVVPALFDQDAARWARSL